MPAQDPTHAQMASSSPEPARRTGMHRALCAPLAALALLLLFANPAAAAGSIRDNGWSCSEAAPGSASAGRIRVRFPQMYLHNPNVRFEGVYVQPVIFKLVDGEWRTHSWTLVTGTASRAGLNHRAGFGTWREHRSGLPKVTYTVDVPHGTYTVGFNYRWDSTGWGNFISTRHDSPGSTTCTIPK